MVDDVLLNKAQRIEHSIRRVRASHTRAQHNVVHNDIYQDAAMFNIQRACEAALDMGQHLIRRDKLGIPQSTKDIFTLLAQADYIDLSLTRELTIIVDFCHLAVHECQQLDPATLEDIIEKHLDALLIFSQTLLQNHAKPA